VSEEHLWPDWMRRQENIRQALQHTQILEHHGQEVERREWAREPYKMTVSAFCSTCNSGWMSQVEQRAQQYLSGMIAGRGRALHREGQEALATWALLKAIVFGQTFPDPLAISDAHPRALYAERKPPTGVGVWITSYDSTMAGIAGLDATEVTIAGQEDPAEPNLFVATLTLGPVALQTIGTTNSGLVDVVEGIAWGERHVHQIWPTQSDFTWMPRPAFTNRGLEGFHTRVIAELIGRAERFEP
jgi:hypothetical protein